VGWCSRDGCPLSSAIRLLRLRTAALAAWMLLFVAGIAIGSMVLGRLLKEDEAIAAADTLLLTVPNQLGVDYNAHVIESILTHVAPALGWR
jgi:hypothetical protein